MNSQAELLLSHCTFAKCQSTSVGGAISAIDASVRAESCTFADNSSSIEGGAIYAGPADLCIRHCTFRDNIAASPGGAIAGTSTATLAAYGNAFEKNLDISSPSTFDADIEAAWASQGYNMFDDSPSGTVLSDAAGTLVRLNGLADNGGYGPTNAPVPALSPALDFLPMPGAGLVPPPRTDGRGYPRVVLGRPDAGAHESGAESLDSDADGLPDWWELDYGFDPALADDTSVDHDGDGENLLAECGFFTDPFDAASFFEVTNFTRGVTNTDVNWSTVAGYQYQFQTSTNLINWSTVSTKVATGTSLGGTVPSWDRLFIRVRAR
jgi:predicted outer membrane repeat protein